MQLVVYYAVRGQNLELILEDGTVIKEPVFHEVGDEQAVMNVKEGWGIKSVQKAAESLRPNGLKSEYFNLAHIFGRKYAVHYFKGGNPRELADPSERRKRIEHYRMKLNDFLNGR